MDWSEVIGKDQRRGHLPRGADGPYFAGMSHMLTPVEVSGGADARRSLRRSARVSVTLAACVLTAAILLAVPAPDALIVGLGLFGCIVLVVVQRIESFHPFPDFGAANRVTLMRAVLACLLAAFVAGEALALSFAAFAIAVCALALDGIDGWLARRSATASRFGARFDMEVDAVLILVLASAAWLTGKAGMWVLLLGLMRYAFVAASAPWPWLARDLPPSTRRKAICVLQVAVLAMLLLPSVVPPVSGLMAAAALGALAWSFAVDIRWLATRSEAT
jgi:phosphatidylglycerophosphate synthase